MFSGTLAETRSLTVGSGPAMFSTSSNGTAQGHCPQRYFSAAAICGCLIWTSDPSCLRKRTDRSSSCASLCIASHEQNSSETFSDKKSGANRSSSWHKSVSRKALPRKKSLYCSRTNSQTPSSSLSLVITSGAKFLGPNLLG